MATAILSPEPPTTAIDAIFEKLLAAIVSGQYAAGVRLPAERELSRQLGASRPTLREALRRLDEWNLVEPRRGSGIVVRPYRDWSIEVIAAYLRYGKPTEGQPSISRILLDLLAIRRALVLEVIRLTGSRISKGGTHHARAAMARAWAQRDSATYVREDFEVMRAVAEAARFTPGLWLLNRMAELWLDAADELRMVLRPPDDYVAVHSKFFDMLEASDTDGAVALMASYLDRHDAKLSAALQVLA
jgi:GntR family transcriptional regulator, transcriptional repressor for pyruvate dehydrogenase complex